MNIRKALRHKPEAHTSALNDVLFILLFFFLIVATLANPNVVKLANPKANTDTKVKQTVVVSINSDQQFFVGTKPTSADSLTSAIQSVIAAAQDKEPTIVINADKLATADNIVAIMRSGQALNVKTVLAVQKAIAP
ncbi:biopolymer transporter ExbD [Taibaiella sp. KBW10]|uniref:ExbD/TolR family protein n=1 Tax=Taibaiella sp. KBW10 TaxID=2153357 RepID=UPI000F5AB440|nr:biopolymer transporter ExbD [Taibaiella sp. KBW10]RQO30255.1 biopolymer transporter ExbD [Taibaiella sp. KBW10]